MAHDFFRSALRSGLVVPNQYQTGHKAPEGCDDGDIADNLSQSVNTVPRTNTRYGQECHVSGQQHGALSESETSVTL